MGSDVKVPRVLLECVVFTLKMRPKHDTVAQQQVLDLQTLLTTPTPTAPSEGGAGCGAVPREPTTEMLRAALISTSITKEDYAASVWRCMYDAALAAPSSAPAQGEVQHCGCVGPQVCFRCAGNAVLDAPTPAPASEAVREVDVRKTLLDLLDSIVACHAFDDLEGGCMGEGPVVQGFRALGLPLPKDLAEWLREDGIEPDDRVEGEDALTPPSEAAGKGGAP